MATSYTQGRNAGEFLISEANGDLSRDEITVASGQNLVAGAVISLVTASGHYAAYLNTGSAGQETAAGILLEAVDASSAATKGVGILRHAEVNANEINWGSVNAAGITAGKADLAAAGIDILVRTAIG